MNITPEQVAELQYLSSLSDEDLWSVIRSTGITPADLARHLWEASLRDPTSHLKKAPDPGTKETVAEYVVGELERSPRGPAYTGVLARLLETTQVWDTSLRERATRVLWLAANMCLQELIALNLKGGTHEAHSDTYTCLGSCLRRWSSMAQPKDILNLLPFLGPTVPRAIHLMALTCLGRAFSPDVYPGWGWNPTLDTKDLIDRVRVIFIQAAKEEDKVLTYYAFESLLCLRDTDVARHWKLLDPVLSGSFYYDKKLQALLSSLGVTIEGAPDSCTSTKASETQP